MSNIAPSVCPQCGRAAYVGVIHVECTGPNCKNYDRATALKHWSEEMEEKLREQEERETDPPPKAIGCIGSMIKWDSSGDTISYYDAAGAEQFLVVSGGGGADWTSVGIDLDKDTIKKYMKEILEEQGTQDGE